MDRFLKAGRDALASGNTLSALFVAICLPDVCGSLISPKAGNGARYRDFATAWIKKLVPDMITADELYGLRNSLLHAGSDEIRRAEIDRFVLMDRPEGMPVIRQLGNVVDGKPVPSSVIINAPSLCSEIFDSVASWATSDDGRGILGANEGVLVKLETGAFEIHGFMYVA